MSEDLLSKLQKDENFKKQNQRNEQKYQSLLQAATYSETKNVPKDILKKMQNKEIYLYFGHLQPTIKKHMGEVAMYLAKNFQPDVKKAYKFIFFNTNTPDNYVLWNFRETFGYMKLEQIAALQEFIVVKPYFYHKTMDWMTFGTIPKFIKSKTKFIYSCRELCQYLGCDLKLLVNYVPGQLYQKELPQLYAETISLTLLRMNIQGQSRSHEQNLQQLQFNRTIQSIIQKNGYETSNLEDYEAGPEGVPTILKMLIFYFETHKEGLLLEGLLRKSVSIDQEKQTINKIAQNNYDYILQVQNPHIIANLIKKFFSSLKTPVFPHSQLEQLMNDHNVEDKTSHMKKIYDSLPEVNKITLTFLFSFLKEKVLKNQIYNKMSQIAISVCINPCIFRADSLVYAQKGKYYTGVLLKDYQKIFGQQEERDNLYRTSYINTQKNFQQQVEIGLKGLLETEMVKVDSSKGSQRVSHHYGSEEIDTMQFLQEAFIHRDHQQKQYKTEEIKVISQFEKEQDFNFEGEVIVQNQQNTAWQFGRTSMQVNYNALENINQNEWAHWKNQEKDQSKQGDKI